MLRSASSSHTFSCQSLVITAHTHSTFSGVLLVAGLPEHGSLSTDSQSCLKHLCHTFICTIPIVSSPKAFWIIWIASMEKCSSLLQNLMQIHCCNRSVILNVMVTRYTYSLNGIYHPHWLVQWSHHCSHTNIPVHSPWLPGYINATQTVLVILTMAGLLPDRSFCGFVTLCWVVLSREAYPHLDILLLWNELHPLQIHMSKSYLQCDGVWRWDLWEVIRVSWGHGVGTLMMGLVIL